MRSSSNLNFSCKEKLCFSEAPAATQFSEIIDLDGFAIGFAILKHDQKDPRLFNEYSLKDLAGT